ncbi:hypothetical protein E2I00_009300 [Balaenoptera physalus]|uniref:MARVEL domain-containing protein n=1 Tax=Balaenoptera physalus TaxID=9770 RepID=A0A643CGS1_BALPH|nr:hypothetical protein E2I00_009300 [Balaenoptera physalus]
MGGGDAGQSLEEALGTAGRQESRSRRMKWGGRTDEEWALKTQGEPLEVTPAPLRSPLAAPRPKQGLSFITFVCYVASSASAFLTAPLLEFLLALCFLFADAMQLNDKWQGLCWPMMDFLRCVTAALIYFAISITAVAKYSDGASKAAGVFGFFATIVFAIDFYLIFNDVAKFLKQGDSAAETAADKAEEENSDSDSD